ncbi:MurR/RpiR family transcriptional regulator [Saccharopolyspora sp. NPDC000995]
MTEILGGFASVRALAMEKLDDFSNSERKVARALLANYPTAGLTTVADLAERGGVSSPTVVRFVTRLGFSGFPSFQRALVHELNGELGSPLKQIAAKRTSEEGVLPETLSSFAEMLSSSYADLPESEFGRLVGLLSDPGREIRVAGGRFSRLLAEYLVVHLRLIRSGVAMVSNDEIDRRSTVVEATSSTVFVVFDYRRYTDLNLRFSQQMADRGVTVCLMTDNWLSPIAKVAKVVLPVRVDSASPFDSLVAATAVTESVIAAVAERRGAKGVERLQQIEENTE